SINLNFKLKKYLVSFGHISRLTSISWVRSRKHINYTYYINNTELNSISSNKDLGVTLTHNLNFQEHIECIVKRHSSEFKNLDSLKLLYCALVRSILEYGSPIWSPYTKSNIEIIEGVQNRFLNFTANKSNTIINQYDYTPIRSLLNLPSLASRLINNHIDAPYLSKHISFNIPAYNNQTTPIFY
ncbi:Reverse transcriptase domain-containing protein, partial [Aphis craccivora]